jgi:hypothetical protein
VANNNQNSIMARRQRRAFWFGHEGILAAAVEFARETGTSVATLNPD